MSLPKLTEIEIPLLQEIEAMGGQAKPQDLYPKVTSHFPQIAVDDLKETTAGGMSKWINRIQWARQSLVLKGELERYPRGLWKITKKGRDRLRDKGREPPPPPPPAEPDKLAGEIKSLTEKLAELAKKAKREEPTLTHDELVQGVKEMGEKLGKVAEVKWGPVYKHDCVWKDNPYANPKLVVEVCDKGNLDKDIASLAFAVKNWGANTILVIFEESDFQAAQKKLAQERQIHCLKADDMVKLHSLLQAGNIQ